MANLQPAPGRRCHLADNFGVDRSISPDRLLASTARSPVATQPHHAMSNPPSRLPPDPEGANPLGLPGPHHHLQPALPLRVTFIFSEYSLHNELLEHYLAARPDDTVSLIKVPLVLRGRSRRETVARIAPRLSRRFLSAKLAESLLVLAVTLTPKLLPRGAVFRRLRWIAARRRLPFLRVDDIMSPPALEFLRAQRPDLVVTLFHQIVRRDLLEIPRLAVINAHPGLLPDFAGIQPYFWALSEGAAETGGTLHLIDDETVDTGRIVGEARFPVTPRMSVQLAYYLTCRSLAQLLPRVVGAFADGTIAPQPQAGTGAYHRWPDSAAMDRLHQRGHSVLSFRDMARILTGHFDRFTPARVSVAGVQ